jgi:exo-beta-1,3-glucanase (GH17 family)
MADRQLCGLSGRWVLVSVTLRAVIASTLLAVAQHAYAQDVNAPARQVPPPSTTSAPVVMTRPVAFEPNSTFVEGVSYGPHRDGQSPEGAGPTRAQIREDLGLLATHWRCLRVYGARGPAETVLQVIHEDKLPLKVMLGVWLAAETQPTGDGKSEPNPAAATANRAEIESAVRLANAFPDIVVAVSVGNETQVFWSAHRFPAELLIRAIRSVRERVRVPVTTADDFNFWNKPESRAVAREVDFIVTHIHPVWAGQPLDRGVPFTREKYDEVARMHPGRLIVIGETGWATRYHTEGEQARLIKGKLGEAEQKLFYQELMDWTRKARVGTFFFEAFDENWKGGSHPDEVEKHWGLYRADRTPKPACEVAPRLK